MSPTTERYFGPLKRLIGNMFQPAKRLVVAVVGGTVVLIGIVMIVTPGPALVVIPIGLAILAIEFAWARRLLRRIQAAVKWNKETSPSTVSRGEGATLSRRNALEENRDAKPSSRH